MAFPSPSTTVPTLGQYQAWFNGLTFGSGTGIEIQKIEGLDYPKVRTQDQAWPRTRGQSAGLDLLAGRDITFTMDIAPNPASGGSPATTLQQNTAALRNALSPRGDIQDPLFINQHGTVYATLARVRKDNIPVDVSYALGNLAQKISVQLHATDPFFYSTPTLAPTAALSAPSGGFHYPWSYPFSYGGGGGGNIISATNNGNVECYPIFVITGPCTYPYVTNLTTGDVLYFDITLNPGDQLVVNSDTPHSVFYYESGTTTPVSRMNVIGTSSIWWSLPPATGPNAMNNGISTVQFSSQDVAQVAGTLEMQYASAYSSIT